MNRIKREIIIERTRIENAKQLLRDIESEIYLAKRTLQCEYPQNRNKPVFKEIQENLDNLIELQRRQKRNIRWLKSNLKHYESLII